MYGFCNHGFASINLFEFKFFMIDLCKDVCIFNIQNSTRDNNHSSY